MARNKYNVDETLETEFNFKHLMRSFQYIKRYKKLFFGAFFFSMVSILCGLLMPLFTANAIDEMIPNRDIRSLIIAGLSLVVIVVVQALCNRFRSRCSALAGQAIIRDIRRDLFTHLQELPFDYFDSRPHGKILVRVINYVNSVSDFLTNGIVNVILQVISLILIAIFMLSLNVKLALVVFAGLPVFCVYIFSIKRKQRRAWQLQANKHSNFTAYLAESINGERVTQSFAREEVNYGINEELATDARKAYLRAVTINHSIWPITMVISKAIFYLIYIIGVIYLRDAIAVGMLVAMTSYANRFWGPIQQLSNYYNQMVNTVSYLERIFQLMDEPITVTDPEGAVPLPQIQGGVDFDHVIFEYEKDRPILKDVSFQVAPGESIALVGPTGAGKSTIINLISRFYNIKSGAVKIDGTDIAGATLRSIRSQMGIMLQDTFIFSGTIIENIRYGRLDATDEECIAAAKQVFADDFISKMPQGYYTVINERGDMLSAGQRQLLSFARTLLSDPKILILDEATSSIDTNTELLVQEGIKQLLKNRTSFVVAHRLSTIKDCDRIMYINDGVIAESGSHNELMEKEGLYYHLYTSQLSND
ncbi:MAG: ABC transporter ATP-binding protein [Lachnospiraceae bacterium]|jgi:ATP-binding cassette subfamily B multidrug efflux pump|nr:ABC transporter ATP-binding protein [Lachnospiraceae bacterium]